VLLKGQQPARSYANSLWVTRDFEFPPNHGGLSSLGVGCMVVSLILKIQALVGTTMH
jgi:hypothetical protein